MNFTVPVLVTKESGLIGKNLTQNGLCTLQVGYYLFLDVVIAFEKLILLL